MTYKKNRNKISKEKQKAISQNGGIIMLVTTKEMFKKVDHPNRPLFSQETTRKIMNHIREESMAEVEVKEK